MRFKSFMTYNLNSSLSLERYELKYLIPIELLDVICHYIENYCDMDHYTQLAPDHFYIINDLYLQALNSRKTSVESLLRTMFSFDMHVRSYGEVPAASCLLEVNYRVGDFVKKKKSLVRLQDWVDIFKESACFEDLDADSYRNLKDFVFVAQCYKVSPSLFTQFRRRAYISRTEDSVRITLDRDLHYQETSDWNICPEGRCLIPENKQSVLLQFQCGKEASLWMKDMIQTFNLSELRCHHNLAGNHIVNQTRQSYPQSREWGIHGARTAATSS